MSSRSPRLSPYMTFSRREWAKLRAAVPLPLSEEDLSALRGLNEPISLDEVTAIYLPLARLLHMYVSASQSLHQVTDTFLGNLSPKVAYVIAIAGSVAVGKSTTARVLKALLEHGPGHPSVDLITTDGFLYPNAILEERGLMQRKGFPESYDVRRLVRFMSDIKSGVPEVTAPIYSHLTYDIVPNSMQTICQPDILIVEGLNMLQRGDSSPSSISRVFVSDFFDFSIYVDADEQNLYEWYVERFLGLRETAFRDQASYFHRYADLSEDEAKQVATRIWNEINAVNLRANIAPTRVRARLILEKGGNHLVQSVRLRKL